MDSYKDGSCSSKYVSVFIRCLNPEYNSPNGTWVNAVVYMRNCDKDSNCFIYDGNIFFNNMSINNL